MKKLLSLSFLFVLFLSATLTVSGQKSDFNGTWVLSRAKSTLPENQPVLGKITINIKGDSLLTERVYDGEDGQEYPFSENLTLDGKELQLTVYEMPRKIKAVLSDQAATVNLESTTTFNGQGGLSDFISRETWKVDKATKTLIINYKNTMSGEESNGDLVFVKSEEGK